LGSPNALICPRNNQVEHRDDAPTRYVMDAATYERLINAVKPN